MPSNFYPRALAIQEMVNLALYSVAYYLTPAEYEVIARDLPVVLRDLHYYPPGAVAPPLDETNWGFNYP